jgi:hypothetical protein
MRVSVSDSLYLVDRLVARCSTEGMTGQIQFTIDMRSGGIARTQAFFTSYKSIESLGLCDSTGCASPSLLTSMMF